MRLEPHLKISHLQSLFQITAKCIMHRQWSYQFLTRERQENLLLNVPKTIYAVTNT